jgi:hypothetical protein
VHPEFTSGEISTTGETICYNSNPNTAIGNTTPASGGDGTVTYSWRSSASVYATDISGATGSTYAPAGPLTATTSYRRYAKDGACSTTPTQSTGTWTVTVRPEFTSGEITNTGETICYNTSPFNAIGNTTSASGGDGSIAYSWRSSADGYVTTISGATGSTYIPTGPLTATTSYRRYTADGTCNTASTVSTGIWTVTVSPQTAGGSVSGGTQVCVGTNNTLLTLSGHTGSVKKWQYSTNGTAWTDISSNTTTTYTATNLITDTWYRAVVQAGNCIVLNSDSTKITIISGMSISGYAKYENNPKTPLSGLKITLKKDGIPQGIPVVTGTNGYFGFTDLEQGIYSLDIASSHSSGQWQTWGGVNNTDWLLVSKHIAGTQYLPANPPVVQITASTKLPHPAINNADATAIRQAAKFPTTGYNYFDTTKWVFSGIDASNALNNIVVGCTDVVRDIMGLCAGDVNGTYVPPSGYKLADPGVELVHSGVIPLRKEMSFAVTADMLTANSQQMGALTLWLNYDPSRIEITGVEMPENAGTTPWFSAENGILYIGWASVEPVVTRVDLPLLMIRAQLRDAVETLHATSLPSVNPIRFTLNDNSVSEIADGDGKIIGGVKLSIPDAGNRNGDLHTHGMESQPTTMIVYPNPARETLNLELETFNPEPETLNLELVNLQGVVVMKREPKTIAAGWHKDQLDVRGIAPGVYFLRANLGGEVIIKKIMITR